MRENTKPSVTAEETAEKSVVYPPPYKVKNNCLYVEKTNKQGPYDQKLCNFTPYLTAEITVDDGACETKRLRIGGEHENGRTLKEIEIAGSELASFNWLLEHWGIDCNLEIGCSIKDSIRYAIQSTAPKALRETIFTVTGWKKINGEWKYLLPGQDSLTVELTGRLKRYEMAKGYSIEDVAIAAAMLDVGIAPTVDSYIIQDTIVCKEKNNILNPIHADEVSKCLVNVEKDELQRAEQQGIYTEAEEHLKHIISTSLAELNYKIFFI